MDVYSFDTGWAGTVCVCACGGGCALLLNCNVPSSLSIGASSVYVACSSFESPACLHGDVACAVELL